MSIKEQSGRVIEFDPNLTILRGTNDTGKSSVLKTIFSTFGALPAQITPRWKNANVYSLIKFTVDDLSYAILKTGDRYTVFDVDDRVLINTSHISELAPVLAGILDFRLILQTRDGENRQAPPAYFFLPYYVDQDAGWSKSWDSFTHLGQFDNWKKDLIDYHTGVRPDGYYSAKADLVKLNENIRNVRSRRDALSIVRAEMESRLHAIEFSLDFSAYESEIVDLLALCNELKSKSDLIRSELERLYDRQAIVRSQLLIVDRAAIDLGRDYDYAVLDLADEVECPTCGVLHQNTFSNRFEFARDEMRCRELQIELHRELDRNANDVELCTNRLRNVTSERDRADHLLESRQGEISLRELIEGASRGEARGVIRDEIRSADKVLLDAHLQEISLKSVMAAFDNTDRREQVRRRFMELMTQFLRDVNVASVDQSRYNRLDCKVPGSGSSLPRSLLAYVFSIIHTIHHVHEQVYAPIVIDSPKQQDPDRNNWASIVGFLRDRQPNTSQMIVALSDDEGVTLAGKSYRFESKLSVLDAGEYQAVAAEMNPYIDATLNQGLFAL